MHKKVETKEELEIFKQIWYRACEEMGYTSEPFAANGVLYLVQSEDGTFIGTAEIFPYQSGEFSTVEKYHSYLGDERINGNLGVVFEADKASLLKEYRKSGHMTDFFNIIMEHSQEFNGKYYIGFMEERFFRSLRFFYKTGIERAGETWEWPEHRLVPILFDIQNFTTKSKRNGS